MMRYSQNLVVTCQEELKGVQRTIFETKGHGDWIPPGFLSIVNDSRSQTGGCGEPCGLDVDEVDGQGHLSGAGPPYDTAFVLY